MAGVTLARRDDVSDLAAFQATDVSVWPIDKSREPMDVLDAYLRRFLAQVNQPQQNDGEPPTALTADDPWRIVAPGIAVRASEYEARFGHLDLDGLRQRMTPEVFAAFVRHIGIIEGPDRVDASLLTSEERR